jgi:tetratricopeptide (TPR) repeat protein
VWAVESESHERQHEETITPVRPGFGTVARRRRGPRSGLLPYAFAVIGTAVLGVLAFVVFVWLPEWVAPPQAAVPETERAETAMAGEPEGPILTEEELAALQRQTEQLLSRLLVQQSRVAALSPASWAAEDWERYRALSRAGDDAYLADAYQDAVPAYSEALELGEALIARSAEIVRSSLSAGHEALEAGAPETAAEQFQMVLVIDAGNAEAERGLARAERLPQVLELVERGGALRDTGELAAAAEAYREALGIDGAWAPARRALNDVNARIEQARFDARMSRGYGALADEDYEAAIEAFESALEMRPESREAREGVAQAEQAQLLARIALAEVRGLAFERRELWAQAIEQYETALQADPTLAFARTGLERARGRADLDVKLTHLIDNPNLLLTDHVLEDARALIEEAHEHESPAGLLDEQVARLSALVRTASTPLPVRLQSDGLTEVTLYRVGGLGTFETTEVALRPGTYTVVGSRIGYRDVRQTFTVLPGRELPVVTIACEERI